MQCMENLGCFPWQKQQTAMVRFYPAFFFFFIVSSVQCFCVSILPVVRCTLLRQMDMGCLTCAQIWVCAVHTKGGQAQTSLHKGWHRRIEKQPLTLPREGIEPRVFGFEFWRSNSWGMFPPCPARGSNPGSLDFNSDTLTTELHPPSKQSSHQGLGFLMFFSAFLHRWGSVCDRF